MSDDELIKETMMLDYSQLVMHNVYMIKENKRLHSIIIEVRDYIESYINQFNGVYPPVDMRYLDLNKILEILDKEGK